MSALPPFDRPTTPSSSASNEPFAEYRERQQAQYASDLAAIYRRESDPSATGAKRRGETRGTLPQQLADCTAYAERLGLTVVADYMELEQGDVWGRPQLQRMLVDLRAGKFHHIVIQHPDRLSRSDEVRSRFKIAVREAHGKYHYANLPLAAEDSIEGRMVEKSSGIVSDLEKYRIRERTQSMRQARARSGDKIIAGGYPKYGYNWVRDARLRIVTYEIDDQTALVARDILERLEAGEPVRRIVDDLNRRGVPTRGEVLRRRGLLSPKSAARIKNHWTRNMVAEIVFSPEYSGLHLNYHTISEYEERVNPLTGIAGRRKRTLLLRKSTRDYLPLDTLLDQYGEYAVPVPPIVDPATQLAAQYRFLARRTGTRGDAQDALLRAGHVFCGYCKNPMAVRRSKAHPNQTEYFCSHTKQTAWTVKPDCSVPSNQMYVARLDAAVWAHITEALKEPEVLVALLTRAHETVGQQTDRISQLRNGAQRDLDTARAEMAALVEQSMQANIHPAARLALNEKMTEVGKRIEQYEDIVREASADAATQQAYLQRVADVRDWAATLSEGIDTASYDDRRNVLFMLGVAVYVWKKSDPKNKTEREGQRWKMRSDWEGLNLQARFGSSAIEKYTRERTENNARNYGIVNALDLQGLLGQPVGKGTPLPDGVLATMRERDEHGGSADASDTDSQ